MEAGTSSPVGQGHLGEDLVLVVIEDAARAQVLQLALGERHVRIRQWGLRSRKMS
ncbi:hypothetical protein SLI_0877 [Streptomyces lividans 1326]|uniref:Uncharacterized protein n=1 Tax=Streptomyces lividans 1326 TaxID=1200984 RepID=A0A7U9HAF5_STRLI|nr:hypothetical protein SLI_0877 [Streptomyces lividans 1326]